jgi:Flp pilus assembly protein TadD
LTATVGSVTEQRLHDISVALRSRRTEQAAHLAQQELARGTVHPLLYNACALWLAEQERIEDALSYFRRADSLHAASGSTKSAIAICLTKLGRYDEAVRAFDEAIALQPDSAALFCRKGFAQEMLQDLAGARQSHMRALEFEPRNPEVLGRLAFLAARRGDKAEALARADAALAGDPTHTAAHIVRATIEIDEGSFEAAEKRLSMLLADSNVSGHNRFLVLGHLGDLRDRQDRTTEAFAAYAAANKECAKLHAGRAWAQPGGSLSGMVAALTMETGRRSSPSPAKPALQPAYVTASHAFLLGFPRSGTTLTEQILASHPSVVTLEERDTLADAVERLMPRSGNLAELENAPERVLSHYRELYWQRVRNYGANPEGKLFVDMAPMSTVKLPLIARLFPDARILFVVRDPRDVVLSCFRRRFGINPTTYEFLTLEGAAEFYSAVMRLAFLWRESLSIPLHEVRYENLVDNPREELTSLCNFLGLGWNDSMLKFSERSKLDVITTVSASQIARGLNREGIGQWRRYADALTRVAPVLAPWVAKFGYPAQ